MTEESLTSIVAAAGKPYDAFFKAMLSIEGVPGALLKERLPAGDAAELLTETATLLNPGFVDDGLRQSACDTLIRVETKYGKSRLAFVVVEHKSRPDKRVALQLLRYITRVYEWWDRQPGNSNKLLPQVDVIVVYQGPEKWTVPLNFDGSVDKDGLSHEQPPAQCGGPQHALPKIRTLDFEYTLVNLGNIPDHEMSNDPNLNAGLLTLKYARRYNQQFDALPIIVQAIAKAPSIKAHALTLLFTYECKEQYIKNEIAKAMPKEDTIMTVVEQIREKCRPEFEARGRQEGITQGMMKMITRLLRRRFGKLSDDVERRIQHADEVLLNAWADRILEASSLDEVFADS